MLFLDVLLSCYEIIGLRAQAEIYSATDSSEYWSNFTLISTNINQCVYFCVSIAC